MSIVLPDELLELRDENERLVKLLTRAIDGLDDEWQPWFPGGEWGDAERQWMADARAALRSGEEGPQ